VYEFRQFKKKKDIRIIISCVLGRDTIWYNLHTFWTLLLISSGFLH